MSRTEERLRLGKNVEMELLVDGDNFRGLGAITIDDVLIRRGRLPLSPLIQSIDGYLYLGRRLLSCLEKDGRAEIAWELAGWPVKNCDVEDHSCIPYIALGDWDRPAIDRVTLFLEPAVSVIDGEEYHGFRYYYKYNSKTRRIRQIMDRQSWEIGGDCVGNTWCIQNTGTIPEITLTEEGRFATFAGRERRSEYGGSALGGDSVTTAATEDPDYKIWYQLGARFGDAQSFDFVTAGVGTLLGYFERMGSINSLVYKPAGARECRVYDHHQFALSSEACTTPKYILFKRDPAPLDAIVRHNRWTRCYDFCMAHYRTPMLKHAKPIPFLLQNRWEIDSYLYHLKSTLPLAKALGFPAINIESCLESANTQQEKPRHDVWGHVRNQCCVWDWRVPDAWGGEAALRELCDHAHELGIEVHCWFNANTTPGSPIVEQHPEWCIRRPTIKYYYGAGFEGHLIYLDLNREDLRRYILERMACIKTATGLDGLWHDSFCLNMRAVNYGDPLLRGQMDGSIKLVEGLCGLGYKYYTETVWGPLGPGIGGVSPSRPFAETNETPALFYDVCAVPPEDLKLLKEGRLPVEWFFRWAAHGAPLSLGAGSWWGFANYDEYQAILGNLPCADRLREINLTYTAVLRRMGRRTLTADGVLWEADQGGVYWALRDGKVELSRPRVVHMYGAREGEVKAGFPGRAGCVYLLDEEGSTRPDGSDRQ